uniref:Uncharacterized protein n=1 Tax=Pertusaria plittiana TaxID=394545 RepID=A0A2P1M551_9LECA|nr:hypothetical protein [Pertusaria plittiana]
MLYFIILIELSLVLLFLLSLISMIIWLFLSDSLKRKLYINFYANFGLVIINPVFIFIFYLFYAWLINICSCYGISDFFKTTNEIWPINSMMEGPSDGGLEKSWSTIDSATAVEGSSNTEIEKVSDKIQETRNEMKAINKEYQKVLSQRDDAQDFSDHETNAALEPKMLDLFDALEEKKEILRNLKKELKNLTKKG